MIKIVDQAFYGLGVIKNVLSSARREEINGENTLEFEAVLNQKLGALVDENSIYELQDEWFDTALFEKTANEDGTYSLKVDACHVSYRLNEPEYNLEYFTEDGAPEYIFGKILEGTGFEAAAIEFSETITFSIQEKKSRRQVLMEFAAYLGGELYFNQFGISILQHRGSTDTKVVIKDRNVRVVSKKVNKRERDEQGNPTVSYTCEPLYLPGDAYQLGDNVRLIQPVIGVNEDMRVVSMEYDPYDPSNTTLEFAKYVDGLASSLYRIERTSVVKDKLYNGTRIGPTYGFENVRGDKRARSYFRSDEMKFQTGDGTGGNWQDRLYFETDPESGETTLVLNGKLSVHAVEKVVAEMDPSMVQDKVGKIGGENFVRDSSFWFLGTPWTFYSDGTNVPVVDTTIGRKDQVCARIDGELGKTQYITQTFSGYWSEKVVVTAFLKIDNVDLLGANEPMTAIGVVAIDGNGEPHAYFTENVSGTSDWSRIMLKIDPSSWVENQLCTEIRLYFYGRDFTGVLYADDFMVQEGEVPTAWMPSPKELKTSTMEVFDDRIFMQTQQFLLELLNVLGDVVFSISASGDSIMRIGAPQRGGYIDIGLNVNGEPHITMYNASGALQHSIRPTGDVFENNVSQTKFSVGHRTGIGWFTNA